MKTRPLHVSFLINLSLMYHHVDPHRKNNNKTSSFALYYKIIDDTFVVERNSVTQRINSSQKSMPFHCTSKNKSPLNQFIFPEDTHTQRRI